MTASLPVEEIKKEFHRAEKSLQSARLLLRDNLLEDALSRAYYAILHAARAVLLAEGVNVTRIGQCDDSLANISSSPANSPLTWQRSLQRNKTIAYWQTMMCCLIQNANGSRSALTMPKRFSWRSKSF